MIYKPKLTKQRRENLGKLAPYLENLPTDYSHFGMAQYTSLATELDIQYALKNGGLARYADEQLGQNECGTVACAVGHGPAAGILFRPRADMRWDGYDNRKVPDWDHYSSRFAEKHSPEWDWLFDSRWEGVDDTHRGAAARIRWLLDGGDIGELDGYYNTYYGEPAYEPRKGDLKAYAPYLIKGDKHIAKQAVA